MMKMAVALIQCMIRNGSGCTRARRTLDLTAAFDIADQTINCGTFGMAFRGAALSTKVGCGPK
jgi:hypothetical protein